MRIFALFEAKDWFKGRIQSALKDKKITFLIVLISISGFFFYSQFGSLFPASFTDSYKANGNFGYARKLTVGAKQKDNKTSDSNKEINQGDVYLLASQVSFREAEKPVKKEIEQQLYQLVGEAPIKEMVPAILKLDDKVGAFVVGIAKKESDWGKRAPSKEGKTCYNYWGYKGAGSRGTSMGYACFENSEEAVETIGKRIETLVSKNINEPRKFVVWKCGSSCAGHDPGAVEKWISDVNLYFGKVMKIQST